MSVTPTFASLLSDFGTHVAAKFRTGAGEPEDHLRGPLERLISGLGASSGHRRVVLAGEERLGDIHARPDYAVEVFPRRARAGPERRGLGQAEPW